MRQTWQALLLAGVVTMAYLVLAWGQASERKSQRPTVIPQRPVAPAATANAGSGVALQNNRLEVDVQNQDFRALLQTIASQGDIDLRRLDELPRKQVSIRFSNLPVVEGLKRLFRVAEIQSYVLVTEAQGESVRVQRILFFPSKEASRRTPSRSKVTRRPPVRSTPRPVEPDKGRQDRSEDSESGSVFDDIKTNTAARRLLSQLVHPNEQVRDRALERLVRLVESDDKQAELLEFLEPLMEDLASDDRTERDEARQEIRKLLRR